MSKYPKISIVTPSLNQVKFLEQTVNSVINQNYPNLEYIIMDGGSTDGSVKIIKKYANRFPKTIRWQSQRDNGQVAAINKGLKLSTGNILAYLNSDDYYLPETLTIVSKLFRENPAKVWLTGCYKILDEAKRNSFSLIPAYVKFWQRIYSPQLLKIVNLVPQPSTFWRRKVHAKIGNFNYWYKYAFDYDFWLRLSSLGPPIIVNRNLSVFRFHSNSKSHKFFKQQFNEEFTIAKNYTQSFAFLALHWVHIYLLILPIYKLFRHE